MICRRRAAFPFPRHGLLLSFLEQHRRPRVSKSEERKGLFGGKYTEHFDDDGIKIGESRELKGVFEDYTEHRDAERQKIAESRVHKGVFEDYTEHVDAEGRITKTRRPKDSSSTTPENTPANPPARTVPPSQETISETDGEEEGLLARIANFARPIGFGLGAIFGLGYAFSNSYGVVGYIISLVVGALIGGLVAHFAVYGIALAVGIVLFVLLLRACGVDISLPTNI